MKYSKLILLSALVTIGFSGCLPDINDPTPTKTLMQGIWEVTGATDSLGNDIMTKVAFPVSAIELTDDNGMVGTQGPLFTYIVYGGSNFISASAKIKQVFDYTNFRFNTGEYFVETGTPDHFTVEAKLQATAAVGGLVDILKLFGVRTDYLQQVIYHKFLNVGVSFKGQKNEIMVWQFDRYTSAVYSYKDAQGNTAIWLGWPTSGFTKATVTFTKRPSSVTDIVKAHL